MVLGRSNRAFHAACVQPQLSAARRHPSSRVGYHRFLAPACEESLLERTRTGTKRDDMVISLVLRSRLECMRLDASTVARSRFCHRRLLRLLGLDFDLGACRERSPVLPVGLSTALEQGSPVLIGARRNGIFAEILNHELLPPPFAHCLPRSWHICVRVGDQTYVKTARTNYSPP